MKRKLFLAIGLLFSTTSFLTAQVPLLKWAAGQGGTSYESGKALAIDGNSVYATGLFAGTADFDPGTGVHNLTASGSRDIYLSKLDTDGNLVWAFGIGGNSDDVGNAIAIDRNTGSVCITGSFEGTVDFDPGTGIEELTAIGQTDIFVAKYNSYGNLIWVKQMGGVSEDVAFGIAVDASSNIYTTGHFYSSADFDPGTGSEILTSFGQMDVFISKLDGNGNFIWAKQFGGTSEEYGSDIAIDDSENIVATGSFSDIVDFDPNAGVNNLTSNGGFDIYAVRLNPSGDLISAASIGGTGNDYGLCNTADSTDNIYVGGQFSDQVDFDPGAGTEMRTSAGGVDAFLAKYDNSGSLLWVNTFGSTMNDESRSIAVMNSGDVVMTGSYRETVDFDPGVGTSELTSLGAQDAYVVHYTSSGDFVWVHGFGNTQSDAGRSIAVNIQNDVFVHGDFSETVDFAVGANTYELTSNGSQDAFTIKMGCANGSVDIIEACESYTWIDGNTYTHSNFSATWVLPNQYGCDSTITLNLTIKQPSTNTIYESACETYTWTEGNGQTYTSSTTASHTFVGGASSGCDSTVTLYLSINQHLTNTVSETAYESFTWTEGNGQTYTSSTIVSHTFTGGASSGCDSTVTLDLTILYIDVTVNSNLNTLTAVQSGAEYQWLDCNSGFSPIPGATEQSYTAEENGSYAVEITIQEHSKISDCIELIFAGIQEQEQSFTLFPNPGTGLFYLETSVEELSYVVTDATGKTILHGTTNSPLTKLNLSDVESGMYFLRISEQTIQVVKH